MDDQLWRTNSRTAGTGSLVSIISNGKDSRTVFGKKMKASEIKLLVNYVRRFRSSNMNS